MINQLGIGPGIYRAGTDVRALATRGFKIAFFMDEGLQEAKYFQNCLRIGRYYFKTEHQSFGRFGINAVSQGRYVADYIYERARAEGVWDDIDVWTAYCESNADNDGSFTWRQLWIFYTAFATRMHEYGKKAAGPDTSVGHGEVGDYLISEAREALSVLDYHTTHDYGHRDHDLMSADDSNYVERWKLHLALIPNAPPHISTECGVYGTRIQPTGWIGVWTESQIIEDFHYLAARIKDSPTWLGACTYLHGTPDPDKWRNWDYLSAPAITDALIELNKEITSMPTLPPVPPHFWPFDRYYPITQLFGSDFRNPDGSPVYIMDWRENEAGITVRDQLHKGLDIGGVFFDGIVRAAFDGKVYRAGTAAHRAGYGIHVIVDHPDGVHLTLDGHLSSVLVNAGQDVVAGQALGITGNSGTASGPHDHHALGAYIGGTVYWRDPQINMQFPSTGNVDRYNTFLDDLMERLRQFRSG